MSMSRYRLLQETAWEANQALYRSGLVIETFGNVSAFDPNLGVLAIKPSGVSYEALRPRDMVVVDLENRVVEGRLKPSTDTPTHVVLYRHFSGIGGVAHTHSPYATAWAQAARPIPIYGTTHADHLPVDVPCTPFMDDVAIRGAYEMETGHLIVETFRDLDPRRIKMVLVAGHGPFTWGEDARETVTQAVVLEALAHMAFLTESLRPNMPRLKQSLIDRHFFRKHGDGAYYGQGEGS